MLHTVGTAPFVQQLISELCGKMPPECVATTISNELSFDRILLVHLPLSARTAGHSRAASPAASELIRSNSVTSLSGTATPTSGAKSDGNLYLECLNCGRQVSNST